MPIRPENRHRYPANWQEIRATVLQRAQHRCEWPGCGIRNHAVGAWRKSIAGHHVWHPLGGSSPCAAAGTGLTWPAGLPLSYREAREFAVANAPMTVIVLTVAHLDHVPEHCDLTNLRAWCQRHHLAYDAEHHRQTAYMTRLAARNNLELFA